MRDEMREEEEKEEEEGKKRKKRKKRKKMNVCGAGCLRHVAFFSPQL